MKKFLEENKRYLELLIVTVLILGVLASMFIRADLVLGAIGRLVNVLKPFIYGFVIAYLFRPMVVGVEKTLQKPMTSITHRKHVSCRGLSIGITFVMMFGIITLMLYAIIPGLIISIRTLLARTPGTIRDFEIWLRELIGQGMGNEVVASMAEMIENTVDQVYQSVKDFLLPNLENIVSQVSAGFGGMLGILKNVLLGCIVAIYMLSSWEKFGAQAKIMLYGLVSGKAADWIVDELSLTDRLFGGFISGKVVDSTIIGVLCFIVCVFLDMPYALLVSVIVGITNIIPFFGPYLGAIPSAILILTESPYKCLVFIVFIIILQQLDGNVIGPKILGDKIGISSFWILFAILFFGSYWGIVGMVVGVPIFGVLYDLAKRIINHGLVKHGKTDMMVEYREQFAAEDEGQSGKNKNETLFSKLMTKMKDGGKD